MRLVQPQKALHPIEVTLLGIDTETRLVQLQKASHPIEVTVLGIVIDLRPLQP
jgi:hypothetical protein